MTRAIFVALKKQKKLHLFLPTVAFMKRDKGLFIKDVRNQGKGLSNADILWTKREGFFQMRTSALFAAKL